MPLASKFIRYWLPILAWMGVIFYFSSIPSLESGFAPATDLFLRKIAHAAEYAILTWLAYRAFRGGRRMHTSKALCVAALVALCYAASDEYHQTFVQGREGRARDVAVDSIGIGAAMVIVSFNRRRQIKNHDAQR